MKIFSKAKDGGPDSHVTGYWLCEFKKLFSIVLLRFDDGSRDAYHTHAFNSVNLVLSGVLFERFRDGSESRVHLWRDLVYTRRETFHKVVSLGTTWVLSFRGPWSRTWLEYIPSAGAEITLTDGRKAI